MWKATINNLSRTSQQHSIDGYQFSWCYRAPLHLQRIDPREASLWPRMVGNVRPSFSIFPHLSVELIMVTQMWA